MHVICKFIITENISHTFHLLELLIDKIIGGGLQFVDGMWIYMYLDDKETCFWTSLLLIRLYLVVTCYIIITKGLE